MENQTESAESIDTDYIHVKLRWNNGSLAKLGFPNNKYGDSPIDSVVLQGRPGSLEVHLINTAIISGGIVSSYTSSGKASKRYNQAIWNLEDKEDVDVVLDYPLFKREIERFLRIGRLTQ